MPAEYHYSQTVNENATQIDRGHRAQGIGKPGSFLFRKKGRIRAKQEKSYALCPVPYALKIQHLFPVLNQPVYTLSIIIPYRKKKENILRHLTETKSNR